MFTRSAVPALRRAVPRVQTLAVTGAAPGATTTAARTTSSSEMRKVRVVMRHVLEAAVVCTSVQAKIIEVDRAREAAAAARVASIGTAFDPFDPALSDFLKTPPPPSESAKYGNSC